MPISHELKKAVWWAAPINFDGTFLGASVRTVETVAAGIGLISALHTVRVDCSGPIAVGTLLIMVGQFAAVPKHNSDRHTGWRARWNIHGDGSDHDS